MGMIGDAGAKGKVKSTISAKPVEKVKGMKRKGTAPVINTPSASDGGGDSETRDVAKRSTKGMRPGIGLPRDKVVEPYRTRNGEGQSFKTVGAKNNNGDAGSAIDEWVKGKRASYK
jgi:hypothetical protein